MIVKSLEEAYLCTKSQLGPKEPNPVWDSKWKLAWTAKGKSQLRGEGS